MKKLNSMNSEMETSLDRGMRKKSANNAFTLAEMMVVMLILSIVMAAFAPVVTTRQKADRNSPWRYTANNSDIYYGLGENQTAMIGQPNKNIDLDPSSRLTITTSSDEQNHIIFKRGENRLDGVLRVNGGGILLGTLQSGGLDTGNVGIGPNVNLGGQDNIAIGQNSSAQNDYSISIGQGSNANAGESIAIGNNSKAEGNQGITVGAESKANGTFSSAYGYHAEATGKNSTAIGEYAKASAEQSLALHSTASGKSSTAIGYGNATNEFSLLMAPGKSTGSGENKSESIGLASTAIGSNTHAKGGYSIGIGTGASATGESSVAIGTTSSSSDDYAISIGRATSSSLATVAIGDGANATSDYAIALGVNTKAKNAQSVAIGYYSTSDGANATAIGTSSKAKGDSSISFGNNSEALGKNSVAIGESAKANGNSVTAIGYKACDGVTGANKTCIGAGSGPSFQEQRTNSSIEAIYLGSAGTFKRLDDRWSGDTNAILELFKQGDRAIAVLNADLIVRGDLITMPRKKKGGQGARYGGMKTKFVDNAIEFDDIGEPSLNWSDRRLKYVGQDFTSGLDKVKQLRVLNYTFKDDEKKTPHIGVIAQDLQKIFPNAVFKDEETGYLKIRTEDIFYAVVNAVKELDTKITALTEQLKIVQEQNKQIIKQNKEIIKQNKDLEARLKAVEASKK